jgi:predicted amidohydrolase YtcJ
VALAGGRILAVGSARRGEALAGPGTRVIDAGGRTLLPGFVESHLHLVLGGNELSQLQLGGVAGFDALAAAFRAYAAANPDAAADGAGGGL